MKLFNVDDCAHRDRATAGAVGVFDSAAAENGCAGRKVRALDACDECFLQLFASGIWVSQRPLSTFGNFAKVLRWNVGGHTNGDTDRAVDQQVRKTAWKNGWLLGAAVVVVLKIDSFFVDVANHLHGQLRHAALGVTRCGSWVVTRRAKVTLTRNQRVAQVPVLNEANQGVIDRAVAVRVVLTHHVTDYTRTLAELLVWAVATVEHCINHAAVHRLHAVAHVW